MSLNFEKLIKNILSPINEIRKASEKEMNTFYENMTISDLDNLLKELILYTDENIRLYICLLIKKFIEEKITQNNQELFTDYFIKNKNNIMNLILSNNLSIKIINIMITILGAGLRDLKNNNNENIYIDNIYDIFSYFSQYYLAKKQTQDIKATLLCLYICKKIIKFMKNETVNKKLETLIKNFYSIIIEDYNNICINIIKNNTINNSVLLECLTYYLKLFKHSNVFIDDAYSDKILNSTYDLNVFILNYLITSKTINHNNNNAINYDKISKYIFDLIFLSNKIIILYISQIKTLSTQTLKKYAEMFYIYIKEENVFNYIQYILKSTINNSEDIESKFLLDIINIFYELLQLSSKQEYADLQIFAKGFTDNAIEVSDFIRNNFWNPEKLKNLLIFILKYYLCFKPKEIFMGQEEPEEFYLWFCNSDSFEYDLRGSALRICRIIFDIYRKELKDIYASMENDLYALTEKEYYLLQNNQSLNDEQLNIKCALLSYFYYTYTYFGSKKINIHRWLDQILLSQIDPNVIIKKKNEIFSVFIIMYILSKIIYYTRFSKFKYTIFMKIFNVFLCKDFDCFLLNLSSIDFIYEYVEGEKDSIELPKNVLNNYIIKICQMLDQISSPDIHNKIIETTNSLLLKVNVDQLNLNFPSIFPILQRIWQNNYLQNISNNNRNNKVIKISNKISIIRSNLLKLIGLFVKKVGLFISFDNNDNNNTNKNNNFYENYFNFIYQIIGYSLSINTPDCEFLCKEAFNLIIFIQDDFVVNTSLSKKSKIKDLNNPITSYYYYPFFLKTYDYLDILLSNLSNSNQYFLLQFSAIEQFISLSFCQEISDILDKINFVDKIIYIFNYFMNNYMKDYYVLYIFNVIEYIYYVILFHSKINQENKKKLNEYIFNLMQSKLSDNSIENNLKTIINNYEKTNDYYSSLKDEDIYIINIYFSIIQIANRYIFINATLGNIINNELNIFIANKIINLSDFIFAERNLLLNIIQKRMLKNCVFNLVKLINENVDKSINYKLNEIYKNNTFLSKKDKALNHWLFFFNKIYNEKYCFIFNSEESRLRYAWRRLIEKDVQLIDSISKEYKIKLLLLSSDEMYNYEK